MLDMLNEMLFFMFSDTVLSFLYFLVYSADISGFPAEPPVSSFNSIPSSVRSLPAALARPTSSPAPSPVQFQDVQPPRPASNPAPSTVRQPPPVACPTPTPGPSRLFTRTSPSFPACQEMPPPAAAVAAAPRPRDDMAAG